MRRGVFVAVEGNDGAGKMTQTKMLSERLNGHRIAFPRYETPVGAEILANLKSEWLVSRWKKGDFMYKGEWDPVVGGVDALVRQALFTFDRYLAAAEIESKLAAGIHVVADRYWLSGVIFGSSDGLDAKMIEDVHARLPQPDLWLLLDVSPEESIKRRPDRRDMYERDKKAAWRRQQYLDYFEKQDRRWQVIDGSYSVERVHERVVYSVESMMDFKAARAKEAAQDAKGVWLDVGEAYSLFRLFDDGGDLSEHATPEGARAIMDKLQHFYNGDK